MFGKLALLFSKAKKKLRFRNLGASNSKLMNDEGGFLENAMSR
jgi:hypothetical protein